MRDCPSLEISCSLSLLWHDQTGLAPFWLWAPEPMVWLSASGMSPTGLLRSAAEAALLTAEMQAITLNARMLQTEQDFKELRELAVKATDFKNFTDRARTLPSERICDGSTGNEKEESRV